MTKDTVKERLCSYIGEKIYTGPQSDLTSELDLLSSGILDSVYVLQLVDFVEAEFGIQFLAHEVEHENFQTIDALSDFILQRQ
jgi:acyl carrier protein